MALSIDPIRSTGTFEAYNNTGEEVSDKGGDGTHLHIIYIGTSEANITQDLLKDIAADSLGETVSVMDQNNMIIRNSKKPTVVGVVNLSPQFSSAEEEQSYATNVISTFQSVFIDVDAIAELGRGKRHELRNAMCAVLPEKQRILAKCFADPSIGLETRVSAVRECADFYSFAQNFVEENKGVEAESGELLKLRNIFANLQVLYLLADKDLDEAWGIDRGGMILRQLDLMDYEVSPEVASSIREIAINALKYGNENRRLMNFSKRISEGNQTLDVGVYDQGIGIPQSEIASIFEPGTRASNAVKTTSNGTGWGLSEVVSKLPIGGSITVNTSDPVSGKRYEFNLTRTRNGELVSNMQEKDQEVPYGFNTEVRLSVPISEHQIPKQQDP